MTNRADILEALAERVEAATGPDRALDAATWYAVIERLESGERRDRDMVGKWPAYTASRDAVAKLMPDGWYVATMGESLGEGDPPWMVRLSERDAGFGRALVASGHASTEPCARLAACLRARASILEKNNG